LNGTKSFSELANDFLPFLQKNGFASDSIFRKDALGECASDSGTVVSARGNFSSRLGFLPPVHTGADHRDRFAGEIVS